VSCMVVPFGSARERRSRTTYRPTVTPEGSTHVDTFTGTTSSFSRTASAKLAVVAVICQQICGAPGPLPLSRVVSKLAYDGEPDRRSHPATSALP
jgi:hypothetical protein